MSLSCHSIREDKSVITFWAFGAEGENVGKLLPEFEKRHPGLHVKFQSIPWTAAHEKLLTAFAGNSTPDVCQLGNTWIPEFSVLHAIESLDTLIAHSGVIRQSSYFPGIWRTNCIDQTLFGVPWYVDTRVIFYRKDILAAAGYPAFPKTWQQWYDAAVKIKRLPMKGEHYAMLLPTSEWAPPVIMGLQNASTLLRDNNQYGNFSEQKFHDAFGFYIRFFQEHLAPVGITQVTNIYQGISEGFFAMYITGPWNIGEFSRRLPPDLQDKWMTAPMPNTSTDSVPGVSLAGGSSLVLFRNSKNKEAAGQLIEFLSEAENQIAFYHLTGDLPARREAWQDSSLANNIYVQAFLKQLEYVAPMPAVPEWERIAMKVQDYSELAAAGRVSVEEALRELDRDADRILEKHRWMVKNR
jgi:multiple sugar transport system substrate-binding protein